jgi:3-oxoacyl-[acyl-carrier protein] reductase
MSGRELAGRVAFVTGASGDLGRVIAETLAAAGADVAVHSRSDATRGEPVAKACRAHGCRAVVVTGEIADLAAMTAARDRAVAALGPVDIVVANAVSQLKAWQPLLDQPLEDYVDQFRSCVLHAVVAAKVFVPGMRERKRGRFIGINAEAMMSAQAGSSAYSAGKAGMDRALRCLAKEVGPDGVTVNQIAPGWMISARSRGPNGEDVLDPAARATHVAQVPLGHRGTDGDVAEAVVFFASERARFITGAFLPVNGGKSMSLA